LTAGRGFARRGRAQGVRLGRSQAEPVSARLGPRWAENEKKKKIFLIIFQKQF
jgi:hypothetical protein